MEVKCFECSKTSILELEIKWFLSGHKNIKIITTNQSLNERNVVYTIIYEEI